MSENLKPVRTKKKLPQCPNCKQKYELKRVPDSHEEGLGYPYLIIHNSQTCPFGLESYQNTIKDCLESVNDFIKKKFPWKK